MFARDSARPALVGLQTNGAPHIDVPINKCAIINCGPSNSQVAAEPLGDGRTTDIID